MFRSDFQSNNHNQPPKKKKSDKTVKQNHYNVTQTTRIVFKRPRVNNVTYQTWVIVLYL